MRMAKPHIWVLIVVSAYTLGQALWYWQTPLGQAPVLDGRENLQIAAQIAEGALPDEPFYRAMLYPALLAFLPAHWMILGIICHIANAVLAMNIARRVWGVAAAPIVTGLLVGLNPVLIHFALDPLDTTLAITLFLGSLAALPFPQKMATNRAARYALSGFLLALAGLARPHFFALLLPICFVFIVAEAFARSKRIHRLAFVAAAALPLCLVGLIQLNASGAFRILPTQGAYNFWKSNNASANGVYLQQSLNFKYEGTHQNPTKMESEILYQRETGQTGTVDELSTYWRRKTLDHILNEPWSWIQLMAFKSYAWLNNVEQYNNKTYAFHKSLSPWLKYNPIGWGALFAMGFLVVRFVKSPPSPMALKTGLALFALYSAGALVYMASARFRIPLAPLLAIAAGGLPLLATQWKEFEGHRKAAIPIVAGLLLLLSFSRLGSVASQATVPQDMMLIADSATRLGRDADAFRWSQAALELNPERHDARRVRLLSYFNLATLGAETSTGKQWSDFATDLPTVDPNDSTLSFVKGVALWNLGQTQAARDIWLQTFERHNWNASTSLAALVYTNSALPTSIQRFPTESLRPNPLLVAALESRTDPSLNAQIGIVPAQQAIGSPQIKTSLERILPPRAEQSANR